MTEWELLHKAHWDTTERLEIPGGWLVRTVWRKLLEMGQPMLDGSAIVFVPADEAEMTARAARPIYEDTTDEDEAEEAVEDVETGGEPEQVGVAGQDHGAGRRR